MPVPPSPGPLNTRTLLKDAVYDRLLSAIEDGTLEPGERLTDAELEQWLGVSRTPIRQALARLADLGLVVIRANASTHVAEFDPVRVVDALDTATTLWQTGARLVLPSASDAVVQEIAELYEGALDACERAARGEVAPHEAVAMTQEASRAFAVRANRPTLLATLRKAEIELAFQLRLLNAPVNWAHTARTLRAAADAVRARDTQGAVDTLEAFAQDVDAEIGRRGEPGADL